MEKAALIQKVEYAYRVLLRIQELEQQKNTINWELNSLMRRPSNGIIKRVFRFIGVYIVIVFIMTCIFSLMQPIISLLGFSILDLLLGIIYRLTGFDMTFLLEIAVFLGCALIDVKYIKYKRKKKEEQ